VHKKHITHPTPLAPSIPMPVAHGSLIPIEKVPLCPCSDPRRSMPPILALTHAHVLARCHPSPLDLLSILHGHRHPSHCPPPPHPPPPSALPHTPLRLSFVLLRSDLASATIRLFHRAPPLLVNFSHQRRRERRRSVARLLEDGGASAGDGTSGMPRWHEVRCRSGARAGDGMTRMPSAA
jgi:hypothetical protein